ncbi:hypothetical protein JCM3765_001384 [Sporobolomyces pararoseus]
MSCTCRTTLSVLSRQAKLQRVPLVRRSFVSTSSILAKASPSPVSPTPAASAEPTPSTSSLSSCPEGTVLKGLNYLKDESPILSKPDTEYPEWLWTLASSPEDGGVVKKSKKSGKKAGASGISEEEAEQQARLEELKRQKRELKLEGRKAIKASNVLRG